MVREPWGKSQTDGRTHHLFHHSFDVASVFRALLRQPGFRARAEVAARGPLTEETVEQLAAIVFLHDIGKLHPGFQAKGWPDATTVRKKSHVEAGAEWLGMARQSDHPLHAIRATLGVWEADQLWAAVLAHHGRPAPGPSAAARMAGWPAVDGYDWGGAASRFASCWSRWFPVTRSDAGALPQAPEFAHFIAGLTMLADWIGSDSEFFPFVGALEDDYPGRAGARADSALRGIGLDRGAFPSVRETDFETLTGFGPRPAQDATGALAPGDCLAILEAETGAGKTEAALWRFAKLFAADEVDGLYFAVPTRAAARQLHGRICRVARRLFGDGGPEPVLAIPGQIAAGGATARRLPGWQVLWDDHPGGERVRARWAAEHATRFLAAPISVGTVDQAMLAALSVKHAHLRAAALSRHLLVIDEVHASDAFMAEVLLHLLDHHLGLGGHALLMSATLGASARSLFLGTPLPGPEEAAAMPYPAVWTLSECRPVAGEVDRAKAVAMDALPGMSGEQAAAVAIPAAASGARVLVIRNTVKDAVATWQAVHATGHENLLLSVNGIPTLHHSRFAAEDRGLLDGAVEAALAASADRASGGLIVIGTQTLEQSLDIDADHLVTDLCPVDVLLQRLGRLQRHRLPRPAGFETPRTVVMVPEAGLDPLTEPRFEHGLGAWVPRDGPMRGIYVDLAGLELTRRLIDAHEVWEIPAMNRRLVEGATHPARRSALLDEMGRHWRDYDSQLVGMAAAQRMHGARVCIDWDVAFPNLEAFDPQERVRTRLGEEGVVVALPEGTVGPFGAPVSRITLPAHWSMGITGEEVSVVGTASAQLITVDGRSFRYGAAGVDKLTETELSGEHVTDHDFSE